VTKKFPEGKQPAWLQKTMENSRLGCKKPYRSERSAGQIDRGLGFSRAGLRNSPIEVSDHRHKWAVHSLTPAMESPYQMKSRTLQPSLNPLGDQDLKLAEMW